MKSSSELKRQAKNKLVGKWGTAILVCFIEGALLALASGVSCGLATLIISGPLCVGVAYFMLAYARRTPPVGVSDMFHGFTQSIGANIVAYILITLYTFLWSLLFIIPGIVKSYAYAMTQYILADHPEYTATEAIEKSQELMKGNKFRLFCLELSFIGWIILSGIAFGIPLIWVIPYMEMTKAEFYQNLLEEKGEVLSDVAVSDGRE